MEGKKKQRYFLKHFFIYYQVHPIEVLLSNFGERADQG